MAAILDLEVNVTSNMYLSPRDGFIKTKLVKNNTLLAKIPHLIPEILNFTFFKMATMAAGGHFEWPS